MKLVSRILSQIIDLLTGLLALAAVFCLLLPFLSRFVSNQIILGVLGVLLTPSLIFLIQYAFLVNQQTVGKGFFSLKVIPVDQDENPDLYREVNIKIMIQREILCKLMSCYLICVPLLTGQAGGHEEATCTRCVFGK